MRISVASRIPQMVPSSRTVSPTRSARPACSPRGGSSRYSTSVPDLHPPVTVHPRATALAPPALHVHRDGVQRNVRPRGLDVKVQRGRVASEAHRTDARTVDRPEQFELERGDLGIGVPLTDRPE